ncbi:unnamed protein product [Blepharisma stoltei]|uniref:Ankyrin repeat protein n=1 Tax=Blepharisma stoltei TaxID=1481888 RepID=A0AAU9IJJ0_9CILI|nr:unnamed protein product [Blepharisma stoltei]
MDEVIKDRLHAEQILKRHGVQVGAKAAGELMMHSARLGLRNILEFFGRTVQVDYKNKFHDTLLHYAARGGNIDIVRQLIELGVSPLARNLFNETPLFYAAEEGHVDVVEVLSEYGGIDYQDKFGDTALHFAAREGNEAICVILLRKARNVVNIANDNNQTALSYALEQGYLDVAKTIERYGGRVNA